jgi:hypothetical protein
MRIPPATIKSKRLVSGDFPGVRQAALAVRVHPGHRQRSAAAGADREVILRAAMENENLGRAAV